MPVAKQQRAPARPAANGTPTAIEGSLLSRAVPVDQGNDDWVHLLLYGRNRVGKTTLACQFPKPLLLISVEPALTGGSRSVRNVAGVKKLRLHPTDPEAHLHTAAELEQVGREARAANPYQTIVIDSGTSLDEVVLAEICGWDEPAVMLAVGHTRPGAKVSGDQYTQRSEVSRRVLRPFMELRCHVVIICGEKDHNPQEGRKSTLTRGLHTESFYNAAMGGGTVKWLQDSMDFHAQLLIDNEMKEVEYDQGGEKIVMLEPTGKQVRRLRCQYHPNFGAGFRSPRGEGMLDVPEFVDDPSWDKIKALADGKPLFKSRK